MHPHDLPDKRNHPRHSERHRVEPIAAVDKDENGVAHILIVEDDADLRQSMVFVLSDEGYAVSSAGDGLEAFHLLEDGLRPNLILLDLMMPKMNGFQFRDAQLDREDLSHIPVVAWTAHNEPVDFAASLCANGVLKKPFDIPELLEMVERVICDAGAVRHRGVNAP